MKNTLSLCGALLLAMPGLSAATDIPLVFKTLDAQQALSFPSGSSVYAMIQSGKPAGLVKEPPAISKTPLYGQISMGTGRLLFRLDESKGNGQGYDRLIVDVNGNGDLTGNPAVSMVPPPGGSTVITSPQQMIFGPVQAPDNFKIGTNRPAFFARVYLFTVSGLSVAGSPNITSGEILLRPGWYLEATINLDGKQHKVDFVDSDCNFHLGDPERPTFYQNAPNGKETNWSFQGGDRILVDWDGSGGLQSTLSARQSCSLGPMLYLDAKPYNATLAADCQTLSLNPWTEPLAELALQPRGEQVNSLQVAWEKTPGDWVLLEPGVVNGKAKVPPGNYRFYSVNLMGKTESGDTLLMSGTQRVPGSVIKAVAGESAPLKCGAPLQISLTSTPATSTGIISGIIGSLTGQSADTQAIQASILGSGGETYSPPALFGAKEPRPMPAATFTVLAANGKKVDSGTLEYG